MSPITARPRGTRPPAPQPCTARNTTSCVMVCARPQSAEPARKMQIAIRNSGLRPYTSPSFPQRGTVADQPDVGRPGELLSALAELLHQPVRDALVRLAREAEAGVTVRGPAHEY